MQSTEKNKNMKAIFSYNPFSQYIILDIYRHGATSHHIICACVRVFGLYGQNSSQLFILP
jgi:hypothetical protein